MPQFKQILTLASFFICLIISAPTIAQTIVGFTSLERNVTLKGLYYNPEQVDSELPVVLVLHGFSENPIQMDPVARRFHQAGHEVFNMSMRQFGDGPLHSGVLQYLNEGDYGFDKIVGDMDFLVQRIHQQTGKKVLIVGHSMGGMMGLNYAAGHIDRGDGHIIKSADVARARREILHGLITLGSPIDLRGFPLQFKVLASSLYASSRFMRGYYPISTENHQSSNIFSNASEVLKFINGISYMGILDTSNLHLNEREHHRVLVEGISPPHSDSVRDFMRMVLSGYRPRRGSPYGHYETIKDIPLLYVLSSKDELAYPRAQVRNLQQRLPNNQENIEVVYMHDFMHIDMIAEQGLELIGDRMTRFAKHPSTEIDLREVGGGPQSICSVLKHFR